MDRAAASTDRRADADADAAAGQRGWEHFAHGADIGVRGFGPDRDAAFEEAALAVTAIAIDPSRIRPLRVVALACDAPDDRLLLAAWLNTVICEMAIRRMVFARYAVRIHDGRLAAHAWGEPIEGLRDPPGLEPKGATLTALAVAADPHGVWRAQCIVDV